MSASPYPYWLTALIGTKETADFRASLAAETYFGDTTIFFYGFPEVIVSYSDEARDSNGFAPFSAIQKQNVVAALEYIRSITTLLFYETDSFYKSNTLTFSMNDQAADYTLGYAYMPEFHPYGSDVYIAIDPSNETMSVGTEGALTLIHEIGPALGLKHPHEELEEVGAISVLPSEEDSVANTVMSYEESTVENFQFEFGQLDIAALHYMFGPNPNARASDDIYEISSDQSNFIWDGAGIDTIDASKISSGMTLHLTPGHHDYLGESAKATITYAGQITINFGTVIENVIGTDFDDFLFGNTQNNVITGRKGSDTIDGGAGIDIVVYSESLSSAKITAVETDAGVVSWKVGLPSGDKDTVIAIERLRFSDKNLALDLDGNAGSVAKVLGAFLGGDGVANANYVGIGLQYLDAGGTYEELMMLALSTVFGEILNSRTVVSTFYQNLTGQIASEGVVTSYANLLDNGDLTILSLSLQVADNEINLSNINLVGLSVSGLEYS